MVRQAHTYLVGAVSGATLIAIAIAAFVLLVSAQVFGEWPIAGLGGSQDTAVHESKPVGAGGSAEPPATAAQTIAGAVGAGVKAGRGDRDRVAGIVGDTRGGATTGSQDAGEAVGGGGGQGGSGASPSNPATGGSGAGSPTAPSAGGSDGSGGSSGSGGDSGGGGGGSSTASTPSQALTEGVNNTVSGLDQTVTGGALGDTGVTAVTEGVVNGVAGPESVVGKTVDGVAGTVGGLLGGGK